MSLMVPPGDRRSDAWNRPPEIIAFEQRVLTLADGLVSWLQSTDAALHPDVVAFMTMRSDSNPGAREITYPDGTRCWMLEKFDRDANMMLADLLQAAWKRRVWRQRHGELPPPEYTELPPPPPPETPK